MSITIRFTLKWWYWFAAVVPLGAGLASWTAGLPLAFAAVGAQILHFTVRTRSLGAFPVQVPSVFLGILALGTWPPFAFLHWLQLAGVLIRLLFDYCLLARTLSLAPGNRREPLSWRLVKRTYLTPPVSGSILGHSPPTAPSTDLLERPAN